MVESERVEFSQKTKDALAREAGLRCSLLDCLKATMCADESGKMINLGRR